MITTSSSVLCCETMFSHYRLTTQERILNKLSSSCADEINFVVCIEVCLPYFCMYVCTYVCTTCASKMIIIAMSDAGWSCCILMWFGSITVRMLDL